MPSFLISGGAGFIGSHIADFLVERGDKVIIVDNFSTGNKENVNPSAKLYEMDVMDPNISRIFKEEKIDFVFHLAAQINLRHSVNDPISDSRTNIIGALNILENAAKYKVKKIVFPSSGTVYGESKKSSIRENHALRPMSPYAINKLSIENYLYYYKKTTGIGMKYAVLRLGNVYGPRQNPKGEAGVVSIFIDAILKGSRPVIFGSGQQTRDYVYVKDVVRAFDLAQQRSVSGCFNIGTGKETSVNQLLDIILNYLHLDVQPIREKKKEGDQKRICLNCDKAARLIEWEPRYDVRMGIDETIRWYEKKMSEKYFTKARLTYFPNSFDIILSKRKSMKTV